MKVFNVILFLVLILSGCSEQKPNLDLIGEQTTPTLEKTVLGPYIEDIRYSLYENEGQQNIEINVTLSEEFEELTYREKYEKFDTAMIYILEEEVLPDCDEKLDCSFGSINAKVKESSYNAYFPSSHLALFTPSMNFNGEDISKDNIELWDDKDMEKEINGTTYRDIYYYMNKLYSDLTKNGENYVPEIHDPQVDEYASERFNISIEQAGEIYERVSYLEGTEGL